jgi:hypothetical protein
MHPPTGIADRPVRGAAGTSKAPFGANHRRTLPESACRTGITRENEALSGSTLAVLPDFTDTALRSLSPALDIRERQRATPSSRQPDSFAGHGAGEPAGQRGPLRTIAGSAPPAFRLHPRTPGRAGNFSALPPAVVLGVISAFEGFVEDFLATALYLRGYGWGQIARRVSMNNPTVATFQQKGRAEFPGITATGSRRGPLQVWNIPSVNQRPATETIPWDEVVKRADGWMEVRHCLTHGLSLRLAQRALARTAEGLHNGEQCFARPTRRQARHRADRRHLLCPHLLPRRARNRHGRGGPAEWGHGLVGRAGLSLALRLNA